MTKRIEDAAKKAKNRNSKLKILKESRKHKRKKDKRYVLLRRSSVTGRFVSTEYVRVYPDLTVVERRRVR